MKSSTTPITMLNGGLELPDPYLPAIKAGRYEIVHVLHKMGEKFIVIDLRVYFMTGVPPAESTLPRDWTEMVLQIDGKRVRSTHPEEVVAIKYFAAEAHGNVLIGGLGIGLMLHGLEKNKNVKSITCVETDGDLINFLSPHFPKVTLVHDDLAKYMEDGKNAAKFDFVYFDTGGNSEYHFYHEAAPLRKKAKQVLKSTSGREDITCWGEDVMRGQIRRSIQRAIDEKFDIRTLSAAAVVDRLKNKYQIVDLDFFTKYGMVKPGNKALSQVAQFVNEWDQV